MNEGNHVRSIEQEQTVLLHHKGTFHVGELYLCTSTYNSPLLRPPTGWSGFASINFTKKWITGKINLNGPCFMYFDVFLRSSRGQPIHVAEIAMKTTHLSCASVATAPKR